MTYTYKVYDAITNALVDTVTATGDDDACRQGHGRSRDIGDVYAVRVPDTCSDGALD